jgi:hypothetical protein
MFLMIKARFAGVKPFHFLPDGILSRGAIPLQSKELRRRSARR